MSVSALRGVLPHEILWTISTSGVPARALQVIAELGVADLLEDSAEPTATLASRCGADPDALERVLRLLVAQGVFATTPAGYTHT